MPFSKISPEIGAPGPLGGTPARLSTRAAAASGRDNLSGRRRDRAHPGRARDFERDEEILRIAVEVVWRKGFGGTKLSDIAEAAGMCKGSLYQYFDSKDEIYARLVNKVRNLFEVETVLDANANAVERLDQFVRSRVEVILQHPLETALFNRDFVRMKGAIGDWAREERRKNFALTRMIILQGQNDGSFRAADPDLIASMIFGVLAQVPTWYERDTPVRPGALMCEVLAYILGGVRKRDASPLRA